MNMSWYDPTLFPITDPTAYVGSCLSVFRTPATTHDLNGDGRADIVTWGTDGTWRIDLSAGATEEGFGAWDLLLTPQTPPGPGRLHPVVADYNSDGFADLAVYNSDTGHWYIKWTTPAVLTGTFGDWDLTLDYSPAPGWAPGSRPLPGYYGTGENGGNPQVILGPLPDGTYGVAKPLHLALVTPTGQWLLDLQDTPGAATLGAIDHALTVLTAAHLTAAPGWAYYPLTLGLEALFVVPDGVPDGGALISLYNMIVKATTDVAQPWLSDLEPLPMTVPSHRTSVVPMEMEVTYLGLRTVGPQESWPLQFPYYPLAPVTSAPQTGFGDLSCRPIAADFDGDALDDRATVCSTGTVRIAYSGTTFPTDGGGLRTLAYPPPTALLLPGTLYPGGLDYQQLVATYQPYHFGCATDAGCTIFDLPAPTGPFLTECLTKWANHPLTCVAQ
ncbi:MAG: VCBS repeat-containing protein [Deltaproteobacteria bacterium]|nr:VCBS repeat-containing protein [Deltaproteobacteria bacterium]